MAVLENPNRDRDRWEFMYGSYRFYYTNTFLSGVVDAGSLVKIIDMNIREAIRHDRAVLS